MSSVKSSTTRTSRCVGLEADEAAGFADAGAGETVLSAPEGTVPSRLASKNFFGNLREECVTQNVFFGLCKVAKLFAVCVKLGL